MTEKELNQLYWLKKEIIQLDNRLRRLENMSLVGSLVIRGMPFGNEVSDNVAKYSCELVDLKEELSAKRQKYIVQVNKIEKYIDSIEDSEIRQIIRLRHVEGLKWEEIGGEMCMSRQSVKRRYDKFIKVEHNGHSTCVIIQS